MCFGEKRNNIKFAVRKETLTVGFGQSPPSLKSAHAGVASVIITLHSSGTVGTSPELIASDVDGIIECLTRAI